MKTTNIRNMRDLPTIQGLKNRAMPANREQIMSELARLEHEKARLEREKTIWLSNQKKAQTRIDQVQERFDLLERMLIELAPKPVLPEGEADIKKATSKYKGINLEY